MQQVMQLLIRHEEVLNKSGSPFVHLFPSHRIENTKAVLTKRSRWLQSVSKALLAL